MTTPVATTAGRAARFALPPGAEATEPPEARGLPRDGVRLLVAQQIDDSNRLRHRRFRDIRKELLPGDLLVVNDSATLPSALDGHGGDGRPVLVHVSADLGDETKPDAWVVEVRTPGNTGPDAQTRAGELLQLPGALTLQLGRRYPDPAGSPRLRVARAVGTPLPARTPYLHRYGRPIVYHYLRSPVPLAAYQNVYARVPGSAEMASAGRPITARVLADLRTRGVGVATITLHCGVASPEWYELPAPEPFAVPPATAAAVDAAHAAGRRVVAVGTSVVRALESAAQGRGVAAAEGRTSLVLGPDRPARVVDGLVTGLHEPEASHLLLLEAVVGPDLLDAAYAAVTDGRYLWHEFGDAMLLLPAR